MKKCKIIAIIPARFNSTRLPGKPLVEIAGIPMIQRVYQQVEQLELIDEVYVATDDKRIADKIKTLGGKVVMTDPDLPSGSDRVANAASQLELSDNTVIINVQGDQPIINPESIRSLAMLFVDEKVGLNEMATLILKCSKDINSPSLVKVVVDKNQKALYFSRSAIPFGRDSNVSSFYKHLGIYAYYFNFLKLFTTLKPSYLESTEKLEQLRVLENGYSIVTAITEHDSPEVDEPKDIGVVEQLLSENSIV